MVLSCLREERDLLRVGEATEEGVVVFRSITFINCDTVVVGGGVVVGVVGVVGVVVDGGMKVLLVL